MKIENSSNEDIDTIFRLYEIATELQKSKGGVYWPLFNRKMVEQEIKEQRQWKLVIKDTIAMIWATTDSDPQIWLERNKDPAIYIHRISTNPKYRGNNLVGKLVSWAKLYAIQNNKRYLRMDTVGENHGLINYYKKHGFDFLGLSTLEKTDTLPAHYHQATVSLFQMSI